MPPYQHRPAFAAVLLLTALFHSGFLLAQKKPDVELEIKGSGFEKIPLALPPFPSVTGSKTASRQAAEIHQVMWDDLSFSGYFDLIDPKLYRLIPEFSERQVRFHDWLSIGANAVFLGRLQARSRSLSVEGRLYDTQATPRQGHAGGSLILGKRYRGGPELARRIGHKLANDVVHSMTGAAGLFLTKIAFSSRTGPLQKEIFVMDYDGQRPVQITRNGSLNLSPAWSPDGTRLAYVTFLSGHPEIHMVDARGKRSTVFARAGDLNSAPEWSPDGKSLVYSVSRGGNSEIVKIDMRSNEITRLTDHPAIDTAPAFSPTGMEIAFTSDRSGTPQIYIMDSQGANLRRVTTQGSYNDSAAWSRQGHLMAYASRISGQFQIVLLDLATGVLRQVTQPPGNHENPRFSPDGMHLVLSSNQSGSYQIYSVNLDGTAVHRLTHQGASETPDWSS